MFELLRELSIMLRILCLRKKENLKYDLENFPFKRIKISIGIML